MSQESRLQLKGRPERSSSTASSIKLQFLFCGLVAVSLITILSTNWQLERHTSLSDPFFEPPRVVPTHIHVNSSDSDSSLFRVPFYVYENDTGTEWNYLNWYHHAIWNGTLISQSPEYHQYKHADDYWMLEHALKHPMRTRDPSQAKLFFVPILLNILAREVTFSKHDVERHLPVCVSNTNNDLVCGMELLQQADESLGKSPWFQRSQGRDHILVASHYASLGVLRKHGKRTNLMSCNMIQFEQQPLYRSRGILLDFWDKWLYPTPRNNNILLPNMYVGRGCADTTKKTFDFSMIASLKEERQAFQTRRDICQWLKQGSFSTGVCGQGTQCPSLGQSKYGFHARGDTWSSQRLMDTLISGTVPLFTSEEQYKILPDFIPWRDLSYLINVSSYQAFSNDLRDILRRPESEYQDKLRRIAQYRDVLDYTKKGPLELYMAKFASLMEDDAKKLGKDHLPFWIFVLNCFIFGVVIVIILPFQLHRRSQEQRTR
jgi:hypothetical protein